jgi:hypothetical protein
VQSEKKRGSLEGPRGVKKSSIMKEMSYYGGDKYWVRKVEILINEKKKYLQAKSKSDQ